MLTKIYDPMLHHQASVSQPNTFKDQNITSYKLHLFKW